MVWTESHDVLLVREITFQESWLQRLGSVDRGKIWEIIAATLNSIDEIYFKVSQRSVRDRYTLLAKKYKKK